jgi:hypothetical protein
MLIYSRTLLTVILLATLCLPALAGCGGAGTSSSTSSGEASGETVKSFIKKGQPNVLPKFGHEAPAKEREQANVVVTESLEARAAADFATQCKTLDKTGLAGIPGVKGESECPAALKKYAEPLSKTKKARTNTLDGPIDVLMVKGNLGYALYHGNDGKDYAVPLEKEDGKWKISSLVSNEI